MSFTLAGVSLLGSDGVDTVSLVASGADAAVTFIGGQKDNDSVTSSRDFGSESDQGDIRMGAGDDTVVLEAAFYGSLRGGDGIDVLVLNHVHDSWINGNKGDDDITINVHATNSTIAGGADNDHIHALGNLVNSAIFGGEGDDLIEVLGAENEGTTIDGGLGKDLITVASGATHFDYALGDSTTEAWDVISGFVASTGKSSAEVVDVLDFEEAGTEDNFKTINGRVFDYADALEYANIELAKKNQEGLTYVFCSDIRATGNDPDGYSVLFADLDGDNVADTAIQFLKAEGSNFAPELSYANII